MNIAHISKKKILMRAALYALLLLSLLPSACHRSMGNREDDKPRIVPKAGMALLVMVRATNWRDNSTIDHYLDGKMIGQTEDGSCYFLTDVTPGAHHVMAHAANWSTARVGFEAGRVYFLVEDLYPGPAFFLTNATLMPMTAKEAVKEMKDIDYRVYDRSHPKEDMSQKDFEEIRDEFEKQVKEDPDRYRDTLLYKGFNPAM